MSFDINKFKSETEITERQAKLLALYVERDNIQEAIEKEITLESAVFVLERQTEVYKEIQALEMEEWNI